MSAPPGHGVDQAGQEEADNQAEPDRLASCEFLPQRQGFRRGLDDDFMLGGNTLCEVHNYTPWGVDSARA